MAPRSVREWLAELDDQGELVTVDEPTSTKYEIAAYIKKSCNEGGPAFHFTNVEGHDFGVIGGLYGTKERVLKAVDVTSHEQGVEKFLDASSNLVEPSIVDDGPVKTVVDLDPDLNDVPIVHHAKRDRGHYITGGVLVANLPHVDGRGQGIHRLFRRSETELTIWAPAERRIGYAYRVNEDHGQPTEVAVIIGPPPAVTMGGISNVPHNVDKYSVTGGLAGEPVELVPCETIDVHVPANAEMVIEGQIRPDKMVSEAPFGEFPGCYSGQRKTPVIEVTGILRRENPLYQTTLTGMPPTENNYMNWLPRSATVRQDAERAVPGVKNAVVKCGQHGGNGMYEAIVSIDKRLNTEPWNVINSVLGGRSQAKYCTVVDDDIDIYDESMVNWAVNTRVQPDRDVHTYPMMVGAPLDPSGPNRQSEKMGTDATVPLDANREEFDPVTFPGIDDVEW